MKNKNKKTRKKIGTFSHSQAATENRKKKSEKR